MEQLELKVEMPPRNKTGEYMFDDPKMIEQCFRNDWIDNTTKMFTGQSLLAWAKRVAPKCAERLESLGFTL